MSSTLDERISLDDYRVYKRVKDILGESEEPKKTEPKNPQGRQPLSEPDSRMIDDLLNSICR